MEYLVIAVEEMRVTAARFRLSGRSSEFSGAVSFELNDERTLGEIAAQIAAEETGSPRVVLCLPPVHFAQRLLQLPFDDLRKVREVLPAQLQGEIALPVEELVLSAISSGEGRYLALWARKCDIGQAIDLFRDAGLEPRHVTASHLAWSQLPGIPDECVIYDGSALAVLHQRQLTFFRAFERGAEQSSIFATLSALELNGTVLPDRLTLLGSGCGVLEDQATLPIPADKLRIPTDMTHLFAGDEAFQQLAGLYAVARACHAGELPDFRQGELAWTAGNVKLRKKLMLTAALVISIIILLFVSQGLQYRRASQDVASLNKSIAGMYREIFPARTKAVDELAEIRGEIKKLSGVESSGGILDLLKKISEAKGATIQALYEAELDGRTVRIKGDARSAQAANEFKAALAAFMAATELGEVKSRPDGSVTFSLTGTLKEGGK